MAKIAFIDVRTMLELELSQHQKLISQLKQNKFDQVYLVTGRNVGDLWRRVLNQGNPAENWQHALIPNVCKRLEAAGIKITAVVTRYDAYLHTMKNGPVKVEKAGDASQFYLSFENQVAQLKPIEMTPVKLKDIANQLSGGKIYSNGRDSELESLDSAVMMYDQYRVGTAKNKLYDFLLKRVEQENRGELHIHVLDQTLNFDDDNPVFSQHKRVTKVHSIADSLETDSVPYKSSYASIHGIFGRKPGLVRLQEQQNQNSCNDNVARQF